MAIASTYEQQKKRRLWYAHGAPSGSKVIPPLDTDQWRPGMPAHWIEQTNFLFYKCVLIRIFSTIQFLTGAAYIFYRGRETIGVFEPSQTIAMYIYQYFFYAMEILSVLSVIFQIIEYWNITFRNCVDFFRIPNDLISPNFSSHALRNRANKAIPSTVCNYPTIDVFIPCYNESVDLITETVVAALQINYPRQLLTVYLCDDGKDLAKRQVICQLRHQYKNVHYVIRPQHQHAKAGNLNYAIQRTKSDLIITLDADFVARPNLIQRLLPYYYIWNPTIGMYEFNDKLAYVQTPQYFRNLSPYDADPLDQRSTIFFELIMNGKDWFNASTLIGTTNLINRAALKHVNYYPYHSITEDSALSIIFHSAKFRSYYVKESLAHGLATTSLWANLRQRARWLKGDWQIIFSKHGPLTIKGLNVFQRLLYLHMTYSRLISIVHLLYDVYVVLLLTLKLSPLDVTRPLVFLIYLALYLGVGIINRYIINFGNMGLDKAECGNVAFEAIFRYTTVKGLFIALFRGDKLKFKVTDKPTSKRVTANSAATAGIDLSQSNAGEPGRGADGSNGDSSPTNTKMTTQPSSRSLRRARNKMLNNFNNTSLNGLDSSYDGGDVIVIEEKFVDNARSTVLGQQAPGTKLHGVEHEYVNLANGQVLGAKDGAEASTNSMLHEEYDTTVMETDNENSENASNRGSSSTWRPNDVYNVPDMRDIERSDIASSVPRITLSTEGDESSVYFSDGHHQPTGAVGNPDSLDIRNSLTLPPLLASLPAGAEISPLPQPLSHQRHQSRELRETLRSGSSSEYSEVTSEDDQGRTFKKRLWCESEEERAQRKIDTRKNLKRTWFNSLMIVVLVYAIAWGIIFPPDPKQEVVGSQTFIYKNTLPTGVAIGFAIINLLPNLLALYLCFIPYLSGWVMTDFQYGRCDQYAVHPQTGRLFVPFSFISLLGVARFVLIVGAIAITYLTAITSETQVLDTQR